MDLEKEKNSVADIMRRVYERGLTTSLGGNISLRCGSYMLITPSSKDKASLSSDDIALVDIKSGENLNPDLKLSIESDMHRYIYLKREDARAIIHAHSPFSSLFSSSLEDIRCDIIAESYYQIKNVVKAPYALMGTKDLAESVSNASLSSNAVLLEKHGVLTISNKGLLEALEILECLENAAKMTVLSKVVDLRPLTDKEKRDLDDLKNK